MKKIALSAVVFTVSSSLLLSACSDKENAGRAENPLFSF